MSVSNISDNVKIRMNHCKCQIVNNDFIDINRFMKYLFYYYDK